MDVQRNVKVQRADHSEASWSSGPRSTTNVLRFSDGIRAQPHVQALLERIDLLLGPLPQKNTPQPNESSETNSGP